MFFDNVMYMFFAMFLYNESVIISNLRFLMKFTLNTKSVI